VKLRNVFTNSLSVLIAARISPKESRLMPTEDADGIRIQYDAFGDPASPPVLLIMGLGAQMTLWDPFLPGRIVGATPLRSPLRGCARYQR